MKNNKTKNKTGTETELEEMLSINYFLTLHTF